MLAASSSEDKLLRSALHKGDPKMGWHWHCKIKPVLKRCMAAMLYFFTLLLLISETQVFLSTR